MRLANNLSWLGGVIGFCAFLCSSSKDMSGENTAEMPMLSVEAAYISQKTQANNLQNAEMPEPEQPSAPISCPCCTSEAEEKSQFGLELALKGNQTLDYLILGDFSAPKKSSTELKVQKTMNVSATAYDISEECCGKWAKFGKTKTGYKIQGYEYIIAVDPKVIPTGSLVYVPGYTPEGEFALAIDTGRKVKGKTIDVLLHGENSFKRAKRWGVQELEIKIYQPPEKFDIHTLQPNETLSEISQQYNVPVVLLAYYNNIKNANSVRQGQMLLIPKIN